MEAYEVIAFPPFSLDPTTEQLWRHHQKVALRPKSLAVLLYLLRHPHRIIAKQEFFDTIWSETKVGEAALKVCIREIRRVLDDNTETPRFIETIPRKGYRFITPINSKQPPESSKQQKQTHIQEPPTRIVGRDAELAQLHACLEKARSGQRQIMFVTGESGIGKTSLVEAFLGRLAADTPLTVARGQCVENYGTSEAYLPILAALDRLCRTDDGATLLASLRRDAPTWLLQLALPLAAADRANLQQQAQGTTPSRMLREIDTLLTTATVERPLLLVLEDLHWSDHATVALLSYLAQQQTLAKLFIIATYRPVEVLTNGHPLCGIHQELSAHGHCEEISLTGLREHAIEEYLRLRFPHSALPTRLAHTLYQRTNGNPLFIVNIVNALVQQGVIGEEAGQWRLQAPLLEATVGTPESVRQVIQKQVERLTREERQLLEVASVAGAEFSTAVLMADGIEARVGEEGCARLAQRGQFLLERGVAEWPDGTVATRYGFSHALYQKVLYDQLPSGRRIRLHQQVGNLLAHGYGARAREIAAELAMHFEQGRETLRAVQHRAQAAQTALQRSAFPEATAHVQQGLTLVATLPETPERAQLELPLHLALGSAFAGAKGIGAPEIGRAFARARELSQQIGDATAIFPVLIGLTAFYNARAEHHTALELAQRCLGLAEDSRDSVQLVMAYLYIGSNLLSLGELRAAQQAFAQGLAGYEPGQHQAFISLTGINIGVWAEAQMAWGLWLLGYLDQALKRSQHAAELARELGHGNTSGVTLHLRGMTLAQCYALGDLDAVTEAVTLLCAEHGIPAFVAAGTALRGWGRVGQGQWDDGLAQLRQGITDYQATGSLTQISWGLSLLADACRAVGRIEEGFAALTEAFAFIEQTDERVYEAELWQLKGELVLQQRTVDSQE